MKAIEIDESKVKKMKDSKILNFLNNILGKAENFPHEDKFEGKKKLLIKWLGWALLISLFIIGFVIRQHLEFRYTLPVVTPYSHFRIFTFYVFVFCAGVLIVQSLSRENYSKVLKLLLFGFIVVLQIPPLIDFFITIPPRAIGYQYVEFADFFLFAFTYLLHPSTYYACGLGHATMVTILISLSSFLVFFKSYYDFEKKIKKNLGISLLKAIICGMLIYLLLVISGSSVPIIKIFFNFTTVTAYSPITLYYYFVQSFNLIWLILLLILMINFRNNELKKLEEKEIQSKLTKNDKKLSLEDYNKIQNSYKSYSNLKYSLIFILWISFEILNLYLLFNFD